MGYVVGLPLDGAATEKDYQVRFGKNMTWQEEVRAPCCPRNGLCKAAYN